MQHRWLECERFRGTVDECSLIVGMPLTFLNKRRFHFESKVRLDRVLVKEKWLDFFSNAGVSHGLALSSDHCPVITRLRKEVRMRVNKQFHYEPMWQRHRQFPEVVRSLWNDATTSSNFLSDVLQSCAKGLGKWNKSVFGYVKCQIETFKTEQHQLRERNRTYEVIKKEKEVLLSLEEWLKREEILWKQRSRVAWLQNGDRNTRFFSRKSFTTL